MNDAARPPVDPYRRWDAAYVLGALSPTERREFEGHLATCSNCQGDVAEIAGLPGLLAQLSPEDAAILAGSGGPAAEDEGATGRAAALASGPAAAGAPAPAGTGSKVREVEPVTADRQRRRLTRAVVALAAALVLVAGVVGVAAVRGTLAIDRPSASAPFRLAFSPVTPTGITAVVDVVPVATGTELRVECQYADEGKGPSPTGRQYAIVVTDRSGHSTPVKTWTARPSRVMTPQGTSPLPVSEIAAVEIRTVDNSQVVLRTDLR